MGWREDEIRKAETVYFNAQSAWESATIRMNNALAKLETLRQAKARAKDEKVGGYTSGFGGTRHS